MALDAVLERFEKSSPLTVMVRLVMQQALSREWLEEVFEQNRDKPTTGILFAIHDKGAAFVIREHGASPNPTELEPLREVGR